ncbi:MAG: hypothetical protein M3460_26575 [Actinomycetota bacterium]|nr:hypothetical protein [Actinomycetota bacterium]
METDSSDLVTAKLLLDHAKLRGFKFQRVTPGEDGHWRDTKSVVGWVDLIHIEGFSRDCFACRKWISSLIVPEGALVEHRIEASALDMLNEALTWTP